MKNDEMVVIEPVDNATDVIAGTEGVTETEVGMETDIVMKTEVVKEPTESEPPIGSVPGETVSLHGIQEPGQPETRIGPEELEQSVKPTEPETGGSAVDGTISDAAIPEIDPADIVQPFDLTAVMNRLLIGFPEELKPIVAGKDVFTTKWVPVLGNYFKEVIKGTDGLKSITLGTACNALRIASVEGESIYVKLEKYLRFVGVSASRTTIKMWMRDAHAFAVTPKRLTTKQAEIFFQQEFSNRIQLSTIQDKSHLKKIFKVLAAENLSSRELRKLIRSIRGVDDSKPWDTDEDETKTEVKRLSDEEKRSLSPLVIDDPDFLLTAEGCALVEESLKKAMSLREAKLVFDRLADNMRRDRDLADAIRLKVKKIIAEKTKLEEDQAKAEAREEFLRLRAEKYKGYVALARKALKIKE